VDGCDIFGLVNRDIGFGKQVAVGQQCESIIGQTGDPNNYDMRNRVYLLFEDLKGSHVLAEYPDIDCVHQVVHD
jgi:hypothetical protein